MRLLRFTRNDERVCMDLLVHTSTATGYIGLADRERVVAQEEFPVGRDLAATLSERIKKFLEAKRTTREAIQKVVVHTGPGSFTGIRLGVTTANAFGYARGIPVVGVSGPVGTPEELFERSRGIPAEGTIAVPTYGQDPRLGPIPSPPLSA
ncbi:MAG: hypothetical protein G01um1014106_497 [Parcubacteria group bacterium Gr01-1014_106]|nr:MAG: hypothetical protein G01um1014106_497 [Parcubacteria group bacterium Gr01-1014_106]